MNFAKNGPTWTEVISKTVIKTTNPHLLNLLNSQDHFFVPVECVSCEDDIELHYNVGEMRPLQDLKLSKLERLRFLHGVKELEQLVDTQVTFSLDPRNIVVDFNLNPILVHRGIVSVMEPYGMVTEADFLKQYKCLVVAMFNKKFTFEDLEKGNLERVKDSKFLTDIVNCENSDDVVKVISDSHQAELSYQEKNLRLVSKKKFAIFSRLTFVFAALAFVSTVLFGYLQFVKIPLQETLLAADEAFITQDYGGVITVLSEVDVEDLPKASKYELAYSYVTVEPLDEEARANVLNTISLKSDDRVLEYWIYLGSGDYEKALDLAKSLGDPQLQLYALDKLITELEADEDISGEEKEEKINGYEEEFNKILEETQGLMNGTEEGATPEETPSTETSSEEAS